jgi:hypothetical protein
VVRSTGLDQTTFAGAQTAGDRRITLQAADESAAQPVFDMNRSLA